MLTMLIGALLSIWNIAYGIGKAGTSSDRIGGVIFGFIILILGFIFLHDTKRPNNEKSKLQRRRAIWLTVIGTAVILMYII